MPDPHAAAALAPYFGMAAAAFGFAGSIVILQATWSTIDLRKTIVEAGEIRSSDKNIAASLVVLKGELNKQQIEELASERRRYIWGASLLAIGFVLAFVRELI